MNTNDEENGSSRYLVFRLGNETFGTPLLGVREVVEYQSPKPVPNSVDYCLGVVNIRGEIVGVLDLRKKFGFKADILPASSMLVFSTEAGSISSVVDQVEAVADIPEEEIEKKPNILTRVPMDFLLGIGRFDSKLITLIDLNKILNNEELTNLKNSKLKA